MCLYNEHLQSCEYGMCKTWKHGLGLGWVSATWVGVPQKSMKCQWILHCLEIGHSVSRSCQYSHQQLSWRSTLLEILNEVVTEQNVICWRYKWCTANKTSNGSNSPHRCRAWIVRSFLPSGSHLLLCSFGLVSLSTKWHFDWRYVALVFVL